MRCFFCSFSKKRNKHNGYSPTSLLLNEIGEKRIGNSRIKRQKLNYRTTNFYLQKSTK